MTDTPTRPDTTAAWLIERLDLSPRPQWMAPGLRTGDHAWTEDANDAVRFPTREAAQTACNDGHISGPLLVTEHMFIRMREETAPSHDQPDTTELHPDDFAGYDMELMAGRMAYLAGLPITVNPHPRDSLAWEWWREGYDQ